MSTCLCCKHKNDDNDDIDDDPANVPLKLKIYFAPLNIFNERNHLINTTDRKLDYSNSHVYYEFNYNEVNSNTKTFEVENSVPFRVNGINLRLIEFHFHDKAENIISQAHGQLEVHFVFQEIGSDLNYAVLGFIFIEGITSDKMISRIKENQIFRIPNIDSYYTFSGSLTKPNILEVPQLAVNWNISAKYLEISSSDLSLFRRKYSRQSADTQPTNGRNIIYAQ